MWGHLICTLVLIFCFKINLPPFTVFAYNFFFNVWTCKMESCNGKLINEERIMIVYFLTLCKNLLNNSKTLYWNKFTSIHIFIYKDTFYLQVFLWPLNNSAIKHSHTTKYVYVNMHTYTYICVKIPQLFGFNNCLYIWTK